MRISHKEANDNKSFIASNGDVMFDDCGCEYEVIGAGRPWAMSKIITCSDCSAREVINAANSAKQKRISEINSRLAEIDRLEGVRAVREERLAEGKIGMVSANFPDGRLVMLEAEAVALRTELGTI